MRKLVTFMLLNGLLIFITPSYGILNIKLTRWVDNAIPIAVVPFAGQDKNLNQANNIAGVITHDLTNSGQFKLLPLAKMTHFPDTVKTVNYPYWRGRNVNELVVGHVQHISGNRYRVQAALVNLFAKQNPQAKQDQHIIFDQSFTIPSNELRALAHHISDMIYQKLLGIRGIFSTRIAYIVVKRQPNEPTQFVLEVSDVDGYDPHALLTSSQPIMSPAWSPNGKDIAYVSFEHGQPQIYVQDVATGQRRLITSFPGINGAPAWSPDGKKLAVVLSKTGNPKIYAVNLSDGHLTQLTHGYSIDTEPAWAPNGRSIIFTSNRGGSAQIYQLNLSDGNISRVTFNGTFNARARFVADGQAIVMLHKDAQGNFDIAEQNLNTGAIRLLTRSGIEESPSVSPNGQMVLYASNVGKKIQLAIVSVDGRVKLRLPARDGDVQGPAWSPFLTS